MKQPIKIAILGYEEFIIKAQKHINAIENVDVVAYKSYGQESLSLAKKLESEGTDVIIAGRINCKYIKNELSIPVVEIRATVIDFINAFSEAKKYGDDTIALSLPDLSIYDIDFDALGCVSNIKIIKVTHSSPEELKRKLEQLKAQGIHVVVGNIMTMLTCEKIGLTGIYVYSMESAIIGCIDKAIEVVKMRRADIAKQEQELAIADYCSEGIIQINEHFRITICNQTAKNLFQLNDSPVLGRSIKEVIPELHLEEVLQWEEPKFSNVEYIRSHKIVINRIPLTSRNGSASALAVFHCDDDVDQLSFYLKRVSNKGFHARYTFENLLGSNPTFLHIVDTAKKYSGNNLPILIEGETGTGKELFAQSIHNYSHRSAGPFVAINCAALSPSLLESELFGYEPGAFTGASRTGKTGLFELANKGTLFLDEINSIPLAIQVKLLRAIEEREIIRVGGNKIIPIDVRILSSSNADLYELCKQNEFRLDLFYRIGTLRIRIPPLRERKEDIPCLIDALAPSTVKLSRNDFQRLKHRMYEMVKEYPFPGNVRELRSFLERLFLLLEPNRLLSAEELDTRIQDAISIPNSMYSVDLNPFSDPSKSVCNNIDSFDGERLVTVLKKNHYKKTETASELGISRSTLYRRMRQTNLL